MTWLPVERNEVNVSTSINGNKKLNIMEKDTIEKDLLEALILKRIAVEEKRYEELPFDDIEEWEEKWRVDERIKIYNQILNLMDGLMNYSTPMR